MTTGAFRYSRENGLCGGADTYRAPGPAVFSEVDCEAKRIQKEETCTVNQRSGAASIEMNADGD
jgi:hypothetical protein